MPRAEMMRCCGLVIAFLVSLLSDEVYGRTFYVATNGSDDNTGEQSSPFRSLQKATDVARADDIVIVRGGLYRGGLRPRFSGESGKPIVFKNADDEKPVLDREGRSRIELQSKEGWRSPIGWLRIEGFEVTNGWDGIKFYNAHHVVIKGNIVRHNTNQGILGNGHHVRIESNVVTDHGLRPDNQNSNLEHGFYVTGTDIEIVNNVIYGNRPYGIQIVGYPFKPDSLAGPEFATAHRWFVLHNTICFQLNRAGLVIWQPEATNCVNIFYRNATALGKGHVQGIDFVGAGSGHVIRNNLFFWVGPTCHGQNTRGLHRGRKHF